MATGTLAQMALAAVPRRPQMLIGGKWVDSDSGETFATFNPATGEKLAEVPRGGTADVDRSVQAAQQAFPAWSRTEARERGKLVARIADKLREHADELGLLDALDSGNPYKAMKGDAILAAEFLDYFAELALEIKGDTIPSPGNTLNFTLREPYGVVGRIIPFNHPIYFAGGKIGAPLVAGNTVILKPAEQTPLSALVMGKLIEGILPPGVLNIVTGDGPLTGETLVRHSGVRKVALTGGVETGRAVMRNAADAIKSVTLELGGKNPMIVFPDVNLEEAVERAVRMISRFVLSQMSSTFRSTGSIQWVASSVMRSHGFSSWMRATSRTIEVFFCPLDVRSTISTFQTSPPLIENVGG